jgi:hypothetical protein
MHSAIWRITISTPTRDARETLCGVSFEIDKALALGNDDTNYIISQNMQMYLLAERLRRVKDAPLSEEIQPFTFTYSYLLNLIVENVK